MASADILRAAHTELPWVVQRSSVSNRIANVSASNSLGDRVTLTGFSLALGVPGEEAYENTEFVVRACNAHYQMLDIAKRWAAIDGGAWHVERYEREREELLADTRAAIAAAEAEAGR